VEYSDKIVGKIIRKLNELGLADNTILIFTGDNGTNTDITTQTKEGSYPGGKGHLQDNGTHVPLIIRWPQSGIKNQVSNNLVEFSDFLPTFTDATQVSVPKDIVGKSFFNLIAGQNYSPRSTVFVHYYAHPQKVNANNGCFIRTVDYKLYSDGRFFDMKNDKWEKSQLNVNALTDEQKSIYKMLKNELDKKEIWDFSKPHRIKNE
ncbi:MAG TPA: sulfatase/phosphatase domain-containing protein, partial [Draconibacterium sp.]|nr:sulfatase/phosphatase domain-containing protein [Draconibacterium sp.]